MKLGLALLAAAALTLTATVGVANAAPTGFDVSVSLGGNFPSGPHSFGNFGVNWTNSGSVDVTGVTHLTLHLPPSLTTSGALMYMQPANYEFTEWVSPDGHELDATFIGTMTPGQSDFMKVEVDSGAVTPAGDAVATASNPRDTNPADNRASVPVAPADQPSQPLPAAARPALTGITTTSGPSSGGTSVTVHGHNLADGFVRFGTQLANTTAPSAPSPSFACTDTACTVTTPPGFGLVPVLVTTPGGTSPITPLVLFGYVGPPPPAPPAPVVRFLSQSSGPAGTSLVIGGTNLDQGFVTFGTVPGPHSSCGPTLCTATAPAGSGQVQVTVHAAGGSSALPFTYT